MDFNLKQWRYQQQHESDLLLQQQQQQQPSGSPSALPLFVPELTSKLTHLSAYPPDATTASRFPKMGSYFSLGQWQELELQALIFRHMLAGASVPPQLLHLLNKTLLNISTPPPPYHHPLQHYPHYHPTLLQTGYWGRGGMDPEPGRCRRTDGKKWRCSRDVVAGHKYCERHMNRGRNRSRKPVEIPTSSSTAAGGGGGGVGGVIKTNTTFAAQPRTAMAGGTTHFSISGPSPSIDLLHLNQRPSESKTENKLCLFETQNEVSGDGQSGGGRVLRCFFDDWPTSLQQQQQPGNAGSNSSPVISSTCLSISTPSSNHPPPPSDFSLKLSTGNADDRPSQQESSSVERERLQLNWAAAGWGTNPVAPMGGPLAEALRSSTASNSSPTSVLHQLQRGSTSETTSYVST